MKTCCGWLYTLSKYGYPPAFDKIFVGIEKAAEWGFEAFEMEAIGENQLIEMLGRKAEVKSRMDDCGVRLINFVPMLPDLASMDAKRREHALDLFARGVELAAYFEAQVIHADSYEVPLTYSGEAPNDDPIHYGKSYRVQVTQEFDWQAVWENIVATMRRMVEITTEHNLRLGVELRLGEAISNTDAWLRLAEHVGHPNFGVIFDTAHLHAQKELLALSVEKLKDRIFFIHAADNDGFHNQHLAPGEGTIDWAALFAALKKHQFDGYIALDIGDTDNLEEAYPKAKAFIESHF